MNQQIENEYVLHREQDLIGGYLDENKEIESSSRFYASKSTEQMNIEDDQYERDEEEKNEMEQTILKFQQQRRQLYTAYQQKVDKMNHLIDKKRLITKKNQTTALPIQLFADIQIDYEFQLFGNINIPTNFYPSQKHSAIQLFTNINCQLNVPPIISLNKRLDCIEVQISNAKCGINKFEFVIDFLKVQPNQDLKQLSDILSKYQSEVDLIFKKQRVFTKMTSKLYEEMEEDYLQFIGYMKEQVAKLDKNTMYKLVVGRMNYLFGDINITFYGLSQTYMKIIGTNYEIIKYALLRGKQIDFEGCFSRSSYLITKQILQRIDNEEDNLTSYMKVITLDGFGLDVQIKLTKISSPFIRHLQTPYDHIGYIETYTISQNQLDSLYQYRQNLAMQNNCISYEQYLNLELSKYFESVEYSVFSEMFLEKYYSNNTNSTLMQVESV